MRILLVNDYASSTGGAEVMTRVLRDGLRRRGHDARVFATRAGTDGDGSFADYTCLGTTSRFRTLLQSCNPWAYARLSQALGEFRPDLVHVRMFLTQLSPLILPLLRDCPSIHHVIWYRPVCPVGTKMLPDGTPCREPAGLTCYRHRCLPLRDWVPLMLQTRLWRRWRGVFNLVVANSEACKRVLQAEGAGRVEVVWNGVPVVPSRPPLTGPPVAAFAGRLVGQKGVDVLLRAFALVRAEIPAARLWIAGDGPERERLTALAAAPTLAGGVSMLGHISREHLERRLAPAWVQVVPSRWAESFGLVAAEAMMRGTAVIASQVGGLGEFVRDGATGLLVRPGDDRALAGALVTLLRDRSLAEKMGRRGREAALAELSDEVCVDRFLALYREML